MIRWFWIFVILIDALSALLLIDVFVNHRINALEIEYAEGTFHQITDGLPVISTTTFVWPDQDTKNHVYFVRIKSSGGSRGTTKWQRR